MTALSDLLAIPEAANHKPQRVGKARDEAPDERTVQRQIVKVIRKMGLRVTAIPNGAHLAGNDLRRMRQMAALKLDGLEAGAGDLLLTRPKRLGGPDMGWMEVKREGGVLSMEQLDFRDRCNADGIKWCCVCSLDTALLALKHWGWSK